MTRSVPFSGRVPFTHCESFYLGEGAAVHYDSHSLVGRGSAYCTYCKAEIFSLINEEKWMVLRGFSQMISCPVRSGELVKKRFFIMSEGG